MHEAAAERFHFRALGLVFSSRLELPGWLAASSTDSEGSEGADVALRLQERPEIEPGWREVTRSQHRGHEGEPLVVVDERAGERRFRYHDGARFHVAADGRRAWLDWPEETSLEAVWLYFCGPVLTWILRLHGRVVLHAAAVSTEHGAVLLAGPSGAGKSTTAAGLALAGCRLLSDDTAALTEDVGRQDGQSTLRVWPDSPRLRLWPGSGPAIQAVDVAALPPLCDGWEKRALDAEAFEAEPQPVVAVYCLQPGQRTSFEPVPPARALPLLVAHAAAAELEDREMRRREFEWLSEMAEGVPVVLVTRPDGLDLAPTLLADLERRVAGSPAENGAVRV